MTLLQTSKHQQKKKNFKGNYKKKYNMYVIQLFLLWRIKRINTNPNLIYTLTPFKKKK